MQSEPQTEVPEGVEVRAVETHKPSGQRQGAVEGKRKGEKTRKGQKEKKGSGKHKSHKRGRVHPHQAEFEAAVDAVVATSNDIGVAGVEVIADAVMAFKLIGQPSARAAAGSGAGSDAGAGARSHATAPATGEAQQKVGGGASAVAPPRKKGARGRPRRRVSFPPTLDALIADRFYSHCTSPVVLMLRVAELLCVRHPEEALPFVWLRAIGSVLRLRTRLGPVGSACLSKASDSGAAVPVAAGTDPVDAGATGAIGSTALKPSATTPDRSRSGVSCHAWRCMLCVLCVLSVECCVLRIACCCVSSPRVVVVVCCRSLRGTALVILTGRTRGGVKGLVAVPHQVLGDSTAGAATPTARRGAAHATCRAHGADQRHAYSRTDHHRDWMARPVQHHRNHGRANSAGVV